jgi:hypothetical protein
MAWQVYRKEKGKAKVAVGPTFVMGSNAEELIRELKREAKAGGHTNVRYTKEGETDGTGQVTGIGSMSHAARWYR